MKTRGRTVAGSLALFAIAGCAAIAGVSELTVSECVNGACAEDAAPEIDSGSAVDTGTVQGEQDTGTVVPCPAAKGSSQVRVGRPETSFCMDTTEVSYAQYREFTQFVLDAGKPTQIAECAWNSTFTPAGKIGTDDQPVAGVDWCDARAYCEWAGKRLCGRIDPDGGTTIALKDYLNPSVNSWLAACAHGDDDRPYPYGSYVSGRCNDGSLDAGTTVPVGSLPQCEGSYPGLKDLSGNVWEWIDGCRAAQLDAGPKKDDCVFHGGAYTRETPIPCRTLAGATRDLQMPDVGFRCCSL